MLPSDELTELRAVAEESMQDTCTIQTPTETNTKGSVETTYADTYTGVKCRIMPVGKEPRQYVTGDKVTVSAQYVVTVPYSQPIQAGYRVVIDGVTYEVLGTHSGHTYDTANQADVALVD